MKDDILSKAAILQRDGETYAVMAGPIGGIMDIPTARRVAQTGKKYNAHTLKLTGAQRLALIGIKEDDIDAVYADLGIKPVQNTELCRQYVKVCPGSTFCSRGQRDTITFAGKLAERYYPFPKIKSKVKIGVAGCFNSCVEPAIKDIGLIGLPKGWILMAGGAGGKDPMLGEVMARNLGDDEVLDVLDKLLKYYRGASQRHQTRNMRLGVIMQKEGKEKLMRVCGLE
ncbi:MAG: NAD(P)/FAD-dependent oxidoreductase [Pseudomonadota bacterium]